MELELNASNYTTTDNSSQSSVASVLEMEDTVYLIFRFMTHRELARLSGVSRHWRLVALSSPQWRTLHFLATARAFSLFDLYDMARASALSPTALDKALHEVPPIRFLVATGCVSRVTEIVFEFNLVSMTDPRAALSGPADKAAPKKNNLAATSGTDAAPDLDEATNFSVCLFTNLRALRFFGPCPIPIASIFKDAVERLPHLRHLDLRGLITAKFNLIGDHLYALLELLPRLETLKLGRWLESDSFPQNTSWHNRFLNLWERFAESLVEREGFDEEEVAREAAREKVLRLTGLQEWDWQQLIGLLDREREREGKSNNQQQQDGEVLEEDIHVDSSCRSYKYFFPLRSLCVAGLLGLESNPLLLLLRLSPSISVLNFSCCSNLSQEQFFAPLLGCNSDGTLCDLGDNSEDGDNRDSEQPGIGFRFSATHQPGYFGDFPNLSNLTDLNVRATTFSDSDLRALAIRCPLLTSLNLGCTDVSTESVAFLLERRALVKLDLCYCSQITVKSMFPCFLFSSICLRFRHC
jgi:hypothetical protein